MLNKLFMLMFIFSFKASLHSSNWLDRKAEGWAWYEEGKKQDNKNPVLQTSKQPAAQKMKMIRESLEETLAEAILEPTLINIRSYLALQKQWMDRSAEFSQNWARVVLHHPELDQTRITPVNQLGTQIRQNNRTIQIDTELRQLGSGHGLLFIFNADDPESLIMARIVNDFAGTYNWKVIPVSSNGRGLPEFPNPQKNNGIMNHIGIGATPALFTVAPISEQVRPVGTGIITLEELKENILRQHNGASWSVTR